MWWLYYVSLEVASWALTKTVDLCVNLRNAGYSVACRERPAEGILRFALAITRKTPWWLTVLGP